LRFWIWCLLFWSSFLSRPSLEFFNTAGRIHNFVSSSIKGVTRRANFNGDFFFSRTNGKRVPASAGDVSFRKIVWVNISFHKTRHKLRIRANDTNRIQRLYQNIKKLQINQAMLLSLPVSRKTRLKNERLPCLHGQSHFLSLHSSRLFLASAALRRWRQELPKFCLVCSSLYFVISLFFECGHCNRGQTPILWEFNSHRISFCLYTNYYLLSTNFLGYQSISDTYPLNPLHHLHKKHRLFS